LLNYRKHQPLIWKTKIFRGGRVSEIMKNNCVHGKRKEHSRDCVGQLSIAIINNHTLNLQKETFTLVHSFGGFSPWLVNPIRTVLRKIVMTASVW
jgi:hypothetical protein